MLTRRNLRIKAFQTLFASRSKGESNADAVVAEYNENIRLFEKMYAHLLLLPHAFNEYLLSEKDFELTKYFPDKEKVREAASFDNNSFVKLIEESEELAVLTKKSPYDWRKHGELFVKIFKGLKTEGFFRDYLVFEQPNREQDREFIENFYGYLFEHNTDFQQETGDTYLDWEHDVFVFYRMLRDSLEKSSDTQLFIQKTYKSEEEDYPFVKELIVKTIRESAGYLTLLQRIAKSWDTDRIARVDIVLMEMAITEFIYFPVIPIKVTINEYLDLAKTFSTDKSHIFINGILDRTKEMLLAEGKIVKEGRGLRDH